MLLYTPYEVPGILYDIFVSCHIIPGTVEYSLRLFHFKSDPRQKFCPQNMGAVLGRFRLINLKRCAKCVPVTYSRLPLLRDPVDRWCLGAGDSY